MTSRAERAFYARFQQRTRELRLAAGLTQAELAQRLGAAFEAYKRHENRKGSSLPPHLMEQFCRAVGCDLADLFAHPGLNLPPAVRGRPQDRDKPHNYPRPPRGRPRTRDTGDLRGLQREYMRAYRARKRARQTAAEDQ